MSHSRDDPDKSNLDTLISQLDDFGNLVLGREKGEAIIFSVDGIPISRVTIVELRSGGNVRVACACPPHIDADRESVYIDKINQNEKFTEKNREQILQWLNNNQAR